MDENDDEDEGEDMTQFLSKLFDFLLKVYQIELALSGHPNYQGKWP